MTVKREREIKDRSVALRDHHARPPRMASGKSQSDRSRPNKKKETLLQVFPSPSCVSGARHIGSDGVNISQWRPAPLSLSLYLASWAKSAERARPACQVTFVCVYLIEYVCVCGFRIPGLAYVLRERE